MAKYLFVYHGGKTPTSEAEVKKVMEAWGQWMGGLGDALVDGGNPVGKSITVKAGSVTHDGGANPVSGYSLVEASSDEDAITKAQGCPILVDGGSVEVAEAHDM